MKLGILAVLSVATKAQSNSTNSSEPISCSGNEDCKTQEFLDSLTEDYYSVTMDDILCAYYETGEKTEDDGGIFSEFRQ